MKRSISSKVLKEAKQEKGSVTLFVLTSLMFFLVVLTLTYMRISNENQVQLKMIEKIQKQYQISNEEMHNVYERIHK